MTQTTPTIKLTRKQAAKLLDATNQGYKGRKITLKFAEKITFYDTNWSGGTCNRYAFVRTDGRVAKLNVPAPWINPVEGKTVELPADVLVIERSYFCGRDLGITIYANPAHLPHWLPEGSK